MSRTATILGATGLIGSHVWEQLKGDDFYDTIRLLVRRPFSHNNPKTEVKLLDFTDHECLRLGIYGSDAVFCAIGTTQKKVGGDKEAYKKIDYDIAVNAAKSCMDTGCPRFLLVSSVGASSKSNNFYLKLKGSIEDAVGNLTIPSVSIFRPSMLLGNRVEKRSAEKVAQVGMQAFSFLIPSKYKSIHAADVAESMIAASKRGAKGVRIYQYSDMKALMAR